MKETKSKILPFIIALSALSVSASAAFYSVTGLSKLFAGASTQVMIMAGSLEIAKLVIASLLYQYWDTLNKTLRAYLSIATVMLMLITSMGIYGYLSAAYQETATKSLNADTQITLLENKKQNFTQQRDLYSKEKDNLIQGITQLQSGLVNNKTSFVDKKGNLIQSTSNANRKSFENQLNSSNKRQSEISTKLDIINDSIFKLDTQIIEAKTNNNSSGELGPLKYLSNLTGASMDNIINWLLLVIIFVFDPLAIALVIAANFAFEHTKDKFKINAKKIKNKSDPFLYDGLEFEPWDEFKNEEFGDLIQENLAPQQESNILNGNDIEEENKILSPQNRINEIEEMIKNSSLSNWRVNKLRKEIEDLKRNNPSDDNIIDYN